ncbi:MAG: glycosyltransferase [Solirubrobacteraceae bacterium]|nr:glycosyltransferase [Solirubrobacteraceae bacterium]
MKAVPVAAAAAQWGLAGVALQRLARGKQRRPPLAAPGPAAPLPQISVVVPARDEELRIAGVLAPLVGAPGVAEVIVVDDRSSDATADVARAHGARVVEGAELPFGWIGKTWALQQGLVAARGEVVVFLDADVQPDPSLPAAVTVLMQESGADLVSAQLRFICPDPAQRILHPALLATLIYRLGPLDTVARVPAALAAINGQCFAARREPLQRAGGFGVISAIPTDDVALARALTAAGWRVVVADGSALGSVRMYESAAEAMREWAGRSLALPGASSRPRQLLDLGVVWAVQGLPGLRLWWVLLRLLATRSPRRALASLRGLDWGLLAVRWSLQLALTKVYRLPGDPLPQDSAAGQDGGTVEDGRTPRGADDGPTSRRVDHGRDPQRTDGGPDPLALLAPLVDPIAAAALTRGTLRPVRSWRGRTF